MAPLIEDDGSALTTEKEERVIKLVTHTAGPMKYELFRGYEIVVILFLIYCAAGVYGGYVWMTAAKLPTVMFTLMMVVPSMLGVTAGAHRLWAHRAYKAKRPLEIMLVFFYLLTNQRSIDFWVRTHRLHHKHPDTDADPHNAARGFFFSHFIWMLVTPHKEVRKRIYHIDLSDVMSSPIIRFEEKYIFPLVTFVAFIFPTYVPTLWGESVYVSFFCNLFRLFIVLNLINSVNSVSHLIGYKPIDTTSVGTQCQFWGALTFGEGFHNYHHAFPYDFRSSETGDVDLCLATRFIYFMSKIGWAYDLKTVPDDTVKARVLKKGDGTDCYYIPNNEKKQDFLTLKYYKGK